MALSAWGAGVKAQPNNAASNFVPKVGFTFNIDALFIGYISGSLEFPMFFKSYNGFVPVVGLGYWGWENGSEDTGKVTYKIMSGSLGFKKFFNVKENIPKGGYVGASAGIFRWGIDYLEKSYSYEETGSATSYTFYGNFIMGYRSVLGQRFIINSEFGITYIRSGDTTVKTTITYSNGRTETSEEKAEDFKYKGFVPSFNFSVGFLF
jgi:hypothetical protein